MAELQQTGGRPSEEKTEEALKQPQRHYVLVGGHRVRSWHAWLAIGVVVGIAAGIILVANRSREVEPGRTGIEHSPLPYGSYGAEKIPSTSRITFRIKQTRGGDRSPNRVITR